MPAAGDDRFKTVTFTFKNLGPIEKAELELGDLTIIAGRNNTGKTYVAYTLYGFLKTWETWPGPALRTRNARAAERSRRPERYPTFERISDQVEERGQAEVPVDRDALIRERKEAVATLTRRFSERMLADVFGSSPDEFESASIGVKLGAEPPWPAQPADGTEPVDAPSIRYDGAKLVVVPDQPEGKLYHPAALRRRLWHQYLRFLFPELSSDPFVLSAERFGISLFYKELDFRKSQLVDLLQKYGDSKGKDGDFPFLVLDTNVSRYARPIKDNIDYTRSIPDLRKLKSEVHDDKFFGGIRKLMNGYYAASGDEIEFRSAVRGDRRFAIPLHLASSSARGLSDLYFFLRHAARRNHLLIIDEPESHLDTANQVLLARLLARLIPAGLKVLLTTHSDYVIKELNNLIMLSSSFAHKARVIKRLGYTKADCLKPERIRAYVAAENTMVRCQIDRFGIDMPHFDETINSINNAASELAARVSDSND